MRYGKASNNKQRFFCQQCKKTFVWKRPYVKQRKEKLWFESWVIEGYSIRQLCKHSGHSHSKLKRIKNYWLDKLPKERTDYKEFKYLIYDGTYFHKNGCFISLMNAKNKNIITNIYAHKEGGKTVLPWFKVLKKKGLNPLFIVMDGEQTVMKTIRDIWPAAKIQRCLYHIQREGMRWLRSYPKTDAARELRSLLLTLLNIKTFKDRDVFVSAYKTWLNKYKDFVKSLSISNIAFKDLKRTMALINNALPDMFHYLYDKIVPSTTNSLESFYSRLKAAYRGHRGLSQKHKVNYLMWYCFLKNTNNP